MKYRIFFLMTVLSAGCMTFAEDDRSAVPVSLQPVSTRPGSALSWVKRGAVYRISEKSGKSWGLIYRKMDGHLSVVTEEVGPIGSMIASELAPNEFGEFLDSTLPRVLLTLLGSRDFWLVDKWYIDAMRGLLNEGDLGYFDHTRIAPSLALLGKYHSPERAEVSGDKWKRCFFVVLGNGGIEKWEITGRLLPFSIDGLVRTEMERADSVMPLPTVGHAPDGTD